MRSMTFPLVKTVEELLDDGTILVHLIETDETVTLTVEDDDGDDEDDMSDEDVPHWWKLVEAL